MAVQTLIQIRRGTTSEWYVANPTLNSGEWGYDTTTKRYKLGDGLTSWNSLPYSAIRPSSDDLVGTSGVGISFASTTGIPVTISVTGIYSTQMLDFNSAVDARITASAVSEEQVQDILGSGNHTTTGFLRNGTGVFLNYDDTSNYLEINTTGLAYSGHSHTAANITDFNSAVTGVTEPLYADAVHTHTSSDITNFNSSVSGLLPITSINSGTGILVTNAGSSYTAAVTGIPLSLVTDVTSSATEVNYLDGTTLGTVVASKVVAVDSNSDISGFRDVSLTRNLIVGGNLTVNGTTTTVNSTTVDIGDNIIQVNVSGAATQGGMQVLDHDNSETHKFVWDIDNSRWEFSGPTSPDIYTSGNISARAITSTVADGTAPLNVTSSTVVTNLNSDKLDGQHGSYYLDWTNTTNKPDPIISGVLTGDVTGSASVTLNDLANGTLTINTTLGANVVGSGNIIDGSIINADINANANIAVTKLAAGSNGYVLQVNNSGTIVWGSIDGGTP